MGQESLSAIRTYFERLDEGDAKGAAMLFGENAVYIRPPVDAVGSPSSELEQLDGRKAIERFFVDRGKRPYRHTIRSALRVGDLEFAEGFVDGGQAGPSTVFLATATLDGDARILRYFATAVTVTAEGLVRVGRVPARG